MRQKQFRFADAGAATWIFVLCFVCLLAKNAASEEHDPPHVCQDEYAHYKNNHAIRWNSTRFNNEIRFSTPACLDESGKMIVRLCSNKSWHPRDVPTCKKIAENNSCPSNFEETTEACLFVTELRSDPWRHPYSLNPNASSVKQPFRERVYWAPIMRNKKYGDYESMDLIHYGHKIPQHRLKYVPDLFDKDCAIFNSVTQEIIPEYCHHKHLQVLIFPKAYLRNACPSNRCRSAGFGSGTCYCIKNTDDCDEIASIATPADRNNLMELMSKEGNSECHVQNPFADTLSDYKAAITANSWKLTKQNLHCAVCSVKVEKKNPSLVLNFYRSSEKLLLTVYNPGALFQNNLNGVTMPLCFVDSIVETEDASVSIVKIYESTGYVHFEVYEIQLKDFVNLYYCRSTRIEDMQNIMSNKVVAQRDTPGNEYVLHLSIHRPHLDRFYIPVELMYVFNIHIAKIRIMSIIDFSPSKLEYVLHLSTMVDKNVTEEYTMFSLALKSLPIDIKVVSFRSSEFCISEMNEELTWPLTQIFEVAVPQELCTRKDGLPVTRVCAGDFMTGAHWSRVIGDCEDEASDVSKYIHSLVAKNVSQESLRNITEIMQNDIHTVDIYFISKIIQNVINVPDYFINLARIFNALLNVNSTELRDAQESLNATDNILDSMDRIAYDTDLLTERPVFLHKEDNLIIHVTKPFQSNISGIALHRDKYGEMIVTNIERDFSIEDLETFDNFVLATFIPERVLGLIDANITITITVYFNDKLFVTDANSYKPLGPIVSVSIPEYNTYLPGAIPIIFHNNGSQNASECAFWDYGKRTGRKKGNWSNVGGVLRPSPNNTSFQSCYFNHLTHFSLLVFSDRGNFTSGNVTAIERVAMDVLNFIADLLTFIGLAGIFATAVMFEKWRKRPGTKILLNMTFAIGAEVVVIQISFVVTDCYVVGPLLHYIVLSKFCWMLVYAILQYMRFVKVLGPTPNNVVVKSSIFGWGFALLPVCIIIFINPSLYDFQHYHLCIPKGYGMYFGMTTPILLIILINCGIFCIVMKEIWYKRTECRSNLTYSYKLQMQLATLLFFILGVPTFFLLLLNLIDDGIFKEIMIYITAVTSNVQGFILFLFYVVFNKETRMGWRKYYVEKNNSSTLTVSSIK